MYYCIDSYGKKKKITLRNENIHQQLKASQNILKILSIIGIDKINIICYIFQLFQIVCFLIKTK